MQYEGRSIQRSLKFLFAMGAVLAAVLALGYELGFYQRFCLGLLEDTKVEIYTTPSCIYCFKAKKLLINKNISFKEYDVSRNTRYRAEMLQRSNNKRTVPQIFIHGNHIGGYDDLNVLNKAGKLDKALSLGD